MLKHVINRALSTQGLQLARPAFPVDAPINLTEVLAKLLFTNQAGVRVLQLGANDGTSDDPISRCVRAWGWQLLAVEPVPATFDLLENAYADMPNVRTINVAFGTEVGELEMHVFVGLDGASNEARHDRLATCDLATARKFQRRIGQAFQTIRVPSKPVDALLDEAGWDAADVIQIDIEGLDAVAVKHIFGLGLRPSILRFEWEHLDAVAQRATANLLKKNGYRYVKVHGDVIAVDEVALENATGLSDS